MPVSKAEISGHRGGVTRSKGEKMVVTPGYYVNIVELGGEYHCDIWSEVGIILTPPVWRCRLPQQSTPPPQKAGVLGMGWGLLLASALDLDSERLVHVGAPPAGVFCLYPNNKAKITGGALTT